MAVGVIVNPAAGGSRMRAAWPELLSALQSRFSLLTVEETQAPDDAARLAETFAMRGVAMVVAVGGDGTVSETVHGLMRARAAGGAAPELGIMPFGTGSDLARGLGLAGCHEELVARLAAGTARRIDVGRAVYRSEAGGEEWRHFVNAASVGISGPIARAVNQGKRRGYAPGTLVFLAHTVRELLRYRSQYVRVAVDDQAPFEAPVALVAVANGRFMGGGMMVAPDARPDDGLLDVVVVRAAGKPRLIADLRQVYSGAHRRNPLCTFLRGRRIVVEPVGEPALLEIDGEVPGRIAARFEVLPQTLTVRC